LSLRAATDAETIFGCRPTEIFGSTETGAFATRAQFTDDEPWRLLPGIGMRCDDDGRLSLLSPYVSETWFETSDRVETSGDGFRFRGRVDRVVKIEGKRISLTEVEQALSRLPWVAAAAAILLPDRPPRLGAAVVLTADGQKRLAELGNFRFGRMLQSALAETQEPAGRPRVWRFVAELPAPGPMGKQREGDVLALFEKTS
jgi:acyl-coenzyme A synthetase/AMP-(fatty) acid ligase